MDDKTMQMAIQRELYRRGALPIEEMIATSELIKRGDMPPVEGLGAMETVDQAIRNAPGSAWNAAKTVATPFLHPLDTAAAMGKTAAGAAQLATDSNLGMDDYRTSARAVGDMYGERYGGWDNLKRTIAGDPVGASLDVTGALSGGGAVLKGAGAVGRVGALSRAGGALAKAAEFTDPVAGIAKLPLAIRGPWSGESLAEKIYGGVLKPSTVIDLKSGKSTRRGVIRTGLDERIPISPGGSAKLAKIMKGIDKEVTDLLEGNPATIPAEEIANNAHARAMGTAHLKENPSAFMAQADNYRDQFLTDPLIPDNIPVSDANLMRREVDKLINYDRKQFKATPTKEALREARANELRGAVAEAVPEVQPLHDRWSQLIPLQKELTRGVSRTSNNNLLGLRGTIAASNSSHPAATLAGAILWGRPWVQSKVAFWLDDLAKKGQLPLAGGPGRRNLPYVGGLMEQANENLIQE